MLINDNFFKASERVDVEKVKIVVCDPTCSGSGMLDNFDIKEQFGDKFSLNGKNIS